MRHYSLQKSKFDKLNLINNQDVARNERALISTIPKPSKLPVIARSLREEIVSRHFEGPWVPGSDSTFKEFAQNKQSNKESLHCTEQKILSGAKNYELSLALNEPKNSMLKDPPKSRSVSKSKYKINLSKKKKPAIKKS